MIKSSQGDREQEQNCVKDPYVSCSGERGIRSFDYWKSSLGFAEAGGCQSLFGSVRPSS